MGRDTSDRAIALIALALVACGGGTDGTGGHDASVDDGLHDLAVPDLAGPDLGCTTDGDGDGHRALACGGDDCDDADANRYPGNAEVCDVANRDEDCDPRTPGFRDADMDSHADALCCNADGATMHCGDDCNDGSPSTHPSANETCNGTDDDCNGMIDDVTSAIYVDCDGDGFGDADRSAILGCPHPLAAADCPTSHAATAAWIATGGDCDDMLSAVHPGAAEACDGVNDDNCDGAVDEMCSCSASDPPVVCGTNIGACNEGHQQCIGGVLTTCGGTGYVGPSAESCNGLDDDCNGATDESLTAPSAPGLAPGACYDGRSGTIGVGVCHAGSYVCSGTGGWTCIGEQTPAPPGTAECGTDANCDGDSYSGATCHAGTSTRPCSVCGSVSGTEGCTSSCAWNRQCETTASATNFYFGGDPALLHPGGGAPGGGGGWNCPHTGTTYICQTGPGVLLGPATYSAWFFGTREDSGALTIRVHGTGGVDSAQGLFGAGTDLDRHVMFTIPASTGCQNINLEVETNGGSIYVHHVQIDRLTTYFDL